MKNRGYQETEEGTTTSVPNEVLQGLVQTIESLKSEVAELKGERPRKTRESPEDKDL
jgi:hypothetical protein